MAMIFFALLVVTLSFNFFMISYQVNGINRLVYGVPVSLFETSLNLYGVDENNCAFFIKDTLEEKLTSYFNALMKRYADDYTLDFYYYNPSNHSLCVSENCSAIEVTVEANLVLNYHYEKTLFYEIRSN